MLITRNHKKLNVILRFKNYYKTTKLLGYSDNLLLTNKGFLKTPNLLFNNNMCLFFNLNNKLSISNEFNLISYKGYLITNYKIIKNISKKNYIDLKFNFLKLYLLFHLYKIFINITNILLNFVIVVKNYKF